MSVKMCI